MIAALILLAHDREIHRLALERHIRGMLMQMRRARI